MLVIRDVQLAAFQRVKDEEFARWTAEQLRLTAPELATPLPDEQLLGRILRTVDIGRGFGLRAPLLLLRFSLLALRHGPNVHRHAQVQAILENPRLTPETRLDRLEGLPPEFWQSLAVNQGSHAWGPIDAGTGNSPA
ncbi:hypothetical protein [Archangium lansingense]|uniref:Uncharacterized protein n=1 Tax=Archangium lansingense TaxID=2995310 RepID=A0ABT4AQF1_9BACT|nr:hypothetical protein [Archangium lansinium]MCY1083404.1 hypothetical protein [Archangium lansinium]